MSGRGGAVKATVITAWQWTAMGLPVPETEYRFHPVRKWRFDYCFLEKKLAIEIEGGIFTQGRHTRGYGYSADLEKYNAACLLGYRVLRYAPNRIGFAQIREAFNQ
jgi:very-short-patch-repair endonuclease